MKGYASNNTKYSGVDDIQWLLQCCGAESYQDWFKLETPKVSYNEASEFFHKRTSLSLHFQSD